MRLNMNEKSIMSNGHCARCDNSLNSTNKSNFASLTESSQHLCSYSPDFKLPCNILLCFLCVTATAREV